MDYSLFTNSGEIGNLAATISSIVENENVLSNKQKQITEFFYCELEERFIYIYIYIYISCSISFVTSLEK